MRRLVRVNEMTDISSPRSGRQHPGQTVDVDEASRHIGGKVARERDEAATHAIGADDRLACGGDQAATVRAHHDLRTIGLLQPAEIEFVA